MANNIVQHRRGTTADWLELDLVPYEGELVIEECDDGTCKCKIGNGSSKFSELSYLSDPLNAAALDLLTKQHQTDITSIADKLAKLKDELRTDLKSLESNTETKINALFVDELRLSLDTLVSDLEQLENTVETINSTSVDKLNKLEEDLSELHSIVLELPVDSSINENIERASQEILEDVDERIQTEKANYETKASEIHASIEKDLIELRNDLTELRSTFSVQFIELQDNLSTLIDTKLNNSIPVLDSRIDTLEADLEAQEASLLLKIQEIYSKINKNYGAQITSLQELLEQLDKETETAIFELSEGLEDLAHSVSKRFDSFKAEVHEVQGLCEDSLSKLAQVRTENELWHLALNNTISNLNNCVEDLNTKYEGLSQDNAEIKAQLKHMPTNSDLDKVRSRLEEHLLNHEGIGILADITSEDIYKWRTFSSAFSESSKKTLYVSDNDELCAGIDLLESVVLDCGTA